MQEVINNLTTSCIRCFTVKPNNSKIISGSCLLNNIEVGECACLDVLEFSKLWVKLKKYRKIGYLKAEQYHNI